MFVARQKIDKLTNQRAVIDEKLAKHLDEFFFYVDTCIETSLRFPIHEDLSEMRDLLKELHGGWLHLVSPIRGRALEERSVISSDAKIG